MNQNEFDMSQFPKTGQRFIYSPKEDSFHNLVRVDDIHNQENPATPLVEGIPEDDEELANDTLGFTNPNLHRRIRINEWHDGKKIYTITESFTTKGSGVVYETKYPIQTIKFVYIDGRTYYWVTSTELVGEKSFKFKSGYTPTTDLPMVVIYETPPLLDDELTYREYDVGISGVYSYRTTKSTLHTEADEGDRDQRIYENEIP